MLGWPRSCQFASHDAQAVLQALKTLASGEVDVLVSDVAMPDVDGYQLMRRVCAQPGATAARVPAVALTAYARELDRKRALEVGFQAHVSKPVEPTELVRVVANLVSARKP